MIAKDRRVPVGCLKEWAPWRVALCIAFLAVIAAVVGFFNLRYVRSHLEIDLSGPEGARARVFFNTGKGYKEKHSYSFTLQRSTETARYSIPLPPKKILTIRIDPCDRPGAFSLKSLSFVGGAVEYEIRAEQLKSHLKPVHEVELHSVEDALISGMSTGKNPQLELSVRPGATKPKLAARIRHAALFGFTAAVCLTALMGLAILSDALLPFLTPVKMKLQEVSGRIGERHIICYDWRSLLLFVIFFCAFLGMIAFKIHFSSLDMWNRYVTQDPTPSSTILGKPKGIRSDEWLVYTPFILSQARRGFPVENESLGMGKTPILMSLPARHYSLAFQPRFWGFFFLDLERGFSFYWAYKVLGVITGFFLLFMLLTRSAFWLSLCGALWVYLSSYTQWWFSTNMPELMTAFSFISVSFIYLLFSEKLVSIVAGALVFVLSSVGFALVVYPPFQVSLFYLGFFVVLGFIVQNFKISLPGANNAARTGIIAISFVLAVGALLYFYQDAQATVARVTDTVYPGRRVATGGGERVWQLFSGFYDMFYVSESTFASSLQGNVCEASNFVLLYPFVAVVSMGSMLKAKRINYLLLAVTIYLLAATLWVVYGFPSLLAKATLFSHVPSHRAYIGLGLGSIILTIVFLAENAVRAGEHTHWVDQLPLASVAFGLLFILGQWLHSMDSFFSLGKTTIVSTIGALLAVAISMRATVLFCLCIAVLTLPGWLTNPIAAGLDPICKKDLYHAARELFEAEPDARWLTFGSPGLLVSNYLKACGLNVFNGTHYTPDLESMKVLDTAGRFSDIYNRYAHISFIPDPGMMEPEFSLLHGDHYEVKIDPCSDSLRKIGIRYAAFVHEPSPAETGCMERISNRSHNGIWLYRYNWAADNPPHTIDGQRGAHVVGDVGK